MLVTMLAAATGAGCWCAAWSGIPRLGLVAAHELGADLNRLALVPDPGADWPEVVAALLDGIDPLLPLLPRLT